MFRYLVVLAILGLPAIAPAQTINKCRNPDTGAVAYSSSPCPSTAAGWKAEFEGTGARDDRDRMTASQAQASIERSRQAAARPPRARSYPRSMGQGATVQAQGVGACEAAKRRRDKLLYDAGPGVSIAYRRFLDKDVNAACK